MKHLSTEELLLLADGELAAERASHLTACGQCSAALTALDASLAGIGAELRAAARPESVEAQARSWARFQETIYADASPLFAEDTHLSSQELLLYGDRELSQLRVEHVERCAECHAALLSTQALVSEVEHELRLLIPEQEPERKLASVVELDRRLYPQKKVVEFPIRWVPVYAAAAAMAFAVLGGYLNSELPQLAPPQMAWMQAPSAPETGFTATASPSVAAESVLAAVSTVTTENLSPERFELAISGEAAPATFALSVEPAAFAPRGEAPFASAWLDPTVPAVSAPTIVARAESDNSEPTPTPFDPALELEGLRILVRAGVWDEEIRPGTLDGRLGFQGTVDDANARFDTIAALEQAAQGRDLSFDLRLRSAHRAVRSEVARTIEERPLGGLVRASLVSHYSDAARRSFRTPSRPAIDAEIARYVNDVFRSQSELLKHIYELERLNARFDDAALAEAGAPARATFAKLTEFHLDAAAREETLIYDRLSEVLPRRFWGYRGAKSELAMSPDAVVESETLLRETLLLDEALTALLSRPAETLDVAALDLSAGELLRRVHTRVRNLKRQSRISLP